MRKIDRSWPKQRHTRHVWVKQPGVHNPPVQGFIIAWRRHSYRWSALVVYVDADGRVIQEWLPADRLGKVPVSEHQRPGNPDYFAGF